MPKNPVSGMLRGGLYTRVVGRRILHYQHLSSTMDEAARLALEGTEEGTVVLAEEQSSARGRFQRQWVTQAGNLYFSIVLQPSLEGLQYVSIICGLAVARAIRKRTELDPAIKWPNDVRIQGKKVCGILVENAVKGDSVQHSIVGIGINVAFDPSTVEELRDTAAGLNAEADRAVDREALLGQVLYEIDRLYAPLRQVSPGKGPEVRAIVQEWRGLLETLGGRVEVRWQDEVLRGLAEDVDAVGNLILRREDGSLVNLPAGEVTSHVAVEGGR